MSNNSTSKGKGSQYLMKDEKFPEFLPLTLEVTLVKF